MAAFASKYARAFADVVIERKLDPARAGDELRLLQDILQSSAELRMVWGDPSLSAAHKVALLDAVVRKAGMSRETRNFLAVLIEHRRLGAFPQIVSQFKTELNQRLGIAEAEVTTAHELGEESKLALERLIAGITGMKVKASYSRDEKILGGAVVRLGSTIYDGSVRGQLQRLKRLIAEG
jgi:F-type H+-transporting ATPase subunit delta